MSHVGILDPTRKATMDVFGMTVISSLVEGTHCSKWVGNLATVNVSKKITSRDDSIRLHPKPKP